MTPDPCPHLRSLSTVTEPDPLPPSAPPPPEPRGRRPSRPVRTGSPARRVRRTSTATDFLDRRTAPVEDGPATWGWRGRVSRLSGGLVQA